MQNYFSSGEFAKLTGVNKRTLHYYHDIGLFKPDFIGENGYHYYSVSQFAQLEFILTLRRIGLSIEEIEAYIKNTSDVSFSQMMKQKKKLIDDSIQKLLAAQAFLEKKAERIQMGMKAKHGDIQRISLPERKMILFCPRLPAPMTTRILLWLRIFLYGLKSCFNYMTALAAVFLSKAFCKANLTAMTDTLPTVQKKARQQIRYDTRRNLFADILYW